MKSEQEMLKAMRDLTKMHRQVGLQAQQRILLCGAVTALSWALDLALTDNLDRVLDKGFLHTPECN